jgi:EpsI family protein
MALASLLIAVAVLPWPLLVRHDFSIAAPPPAAERFEAFLSGCETVGDTFPIKANYETATWRLERRVRCDGEEFAVLAAWYRQQGPGRELIAEANQRLFGDGWWIKPAYLRAQGMDDAAVDVAQQEFQMGQVRVLTRRVYWVGGWTATNEIVAKLLLGAAKVLGRGDDSAVVMWARVTGPEGTDEAVRQLEQFGATRASRLLRRFDDILQGRP